MHSTNNKIGLAFERGAQKIKYNTFLEKFCNGKIYNKPSIEEQKMIQSRLSVPYKLGQIARPIPGHREGDPINGTHDRSAIGKLGGRTFLFTILSRKDKTSVEAALKGFNHMLNRFEV